MSSERQEKFSGTKAVERHLSFDTSRLEAYLTGRIEGFAGPLEVREFKGGQSNPTYQLVTPSAKYVLRRKPPGKLLPSAHAVEREYRVIAALHECDFPVPRAHLLCEDGHVVGTAFYVMEMVEGRVYWELSLPGSNPAERAAIYDAMVENLARLQAIDYRAAGLEGFGKTTDYFARQIHRWTKNYVVSETEAIPDMDRLNAWLPENIPADDAVSIIHGDYRMDNMIFHPSEPRLVAVLDWELSTLGHPLGDFTYHLLPWLLPDMGENVSSLAGVDLAALGIPSMDDYIERYCALTGRGGIPHPHYYYAYNLWRIAAIYQGIVKRAHDGTAASVDAPQTAEIVRELAAGAWGYATKAGARRGVGET